MHRLRKRDTLPDASNLHGCVEMVYLEDCQAAAQRKARDRTFAPALIAEGGSRT